MKKQPKGLRIFRKESGNVFYNNTTKMPNHKNNQFFDLVCVCVH